MPHPDRLAVLRPTLSSRLLVACTGLALALLACPAAPAAGDEVPTLRLNGVHPGGLRIYVTNSWGTFDIDLTNLSDTDRRGRVVVFYQGRPDVEYGREVWVPAHSTVRTWMLVGPAPAETPGSTCEIEFLLYDRTDGTDRLLRPRGDEFVRARGIIYHKREPFTSILLDDSAPGEIVEGELPRTDTPAEEAVRFARSFRETRGLSEAVHRVSTRSLPTTAQAFDGVDQFVVASGEIAQNPAGMRALRQWLEHGGKLWVMLDLVDPEVLAPLLGEALDFQLVDRVPLSQFRVEEQPTGAEEREQKPDRPITFARVLLPPGEQSRHTVNGWPAWFSRQVGLGQVVFTTLGARGWYRPRVRWAFPELVGSTMGLLASPQAKGPLLAASALFTGRSSEYLSPFEHFPDSPTPTRPLVALGEVLHPPPEPDPYRPEALRPLLDPEIAYSVVGRGWVVAVFGGFLLAGLALGLVLRKSRRPELVGWLGPAVALGAAAVFLGLGETSRRAVPPTVAAVQVVRPVEGRDEADVRGLLAVYRPDSGPAEVGAASGGYFDLDMGGLSGQSRRFLMTDLGAWHWDNLNLPAGVRFAPFNYTAPTAQPMEAVGHFGPEGLEGRLAPGPFGEPADALLNPANGRNLALRMGPDGTFRAGAADVLPAGQFLAGAVLSDRQQRRQEFYRGALKPPAAGRPDGPTTLMTWARPIDMHFTLASGARTSGEALLALPLRLERSPAGERATIPGPLVSCRRLLEGHSVRPTYEGGQGAAMNLRFQLPAAVLPFQVEKATLLARVAAPGRRVTVSGVAGGAASVLSAVESPLDPIRVEVADARFLGLDAEGGLRLDLTISSTLGGDDAGRSLTAASEKWTIEYLELEVTGRSQ